MDQTKTILLVGVGGQGTILVSKVLTRGLLEAGYDVKMSEVHGMAQRGGSVSTQVRFGPKVYSPLVGPGQADVLVSFEKMEAVRWAHYLRPQGVAVVNDYAIPSLPVATGVAQYPQGTLEAMARHFRTVAVDAAALAAQAGNAKSMNIVLMGALTQVLPMGKVDWASAICAELPEKLHGVNLRAFRLGMEAVAQTVAPA